MTTYAELRVKVARDLRDPSHRTFSDDELKDLVNAGIIEVSRIAPMRFQEDITPVADQSAYTVLSDSFDAPVPEIEVTRVEVWDGTVTPNKCRGRVQPAAGQPLNHSQSGWKVWGGTLELPTSVVGGIDPDKHFLKVWGYAPYPPLSSDSDNFAGSAEVEQAVRWYIQTEAINRLIIDRDLFTQWQTRAGNSDVSPASLMNSLNVAMAQWQRRSRSLAVTRELA